MQNEEELLEQQMNANKEAFKNAKLSDLANGNSDFYHGMPKEKPTEPVERIVPQSKETDPSMPSIRTYQGDVEYAVKNDSLTASKMIAMQSNSQNTVEAEAPTAKKIPIMNILLITLICIFVLGGGGFLGYVYLFKKPPVTRILPPQKNEAIVYEEKADLVLNPFIKKNILEALKAEKLKTPKDALIRKVNIYALSEEDVKREISTEEYLKEMSGFFGDELIRSLARNFFFGIYFRGEGEPFMIFETSSFDTASPALLKTEEHMKDDFVSIFSDFSLAPQEFEFKDRVIENIDTRSLQNEAGEILFFYAIIDTKIIVFTKTPETFKEIQKRIRERKLIGN